MKCISNNTWNIAKKSKNVDSNNMALFVCSGNITECLPWLHLATCFENTNQQAADSNADERISSVWSIVNWTVVCWIHINWLTCGFIHDLCTMCPCATFSADVWHWLHCISCTVAVYIARCAHVSCINLYSNIIFQFHFCNSFEKHLKQMYSLFV